MISSDGRSMSTRNISDKGDSRKSNSSSRSTFVLDDEPDIMINGKRVDKIASLPRRSTESLRKSFDEFKVPDFEEPDDYVDFRSANRKSSSLSSRTTSANVKSAPKFHSQDRKSIDTHNAQVRNSYKPSTSGGRRTTFLDRSTVEGDAELRDRRDREYYLLQLDKRMQEYSWVLVPDDVTSWSVAELKDLYESVELDINSNESSSIYSIGLFAATGVIWLISSKLFKYKYSFNLACILVGSFHKFKPYIIQLSRKGKGKTFYSEWHPGIKLAIQFSMTIVVSVVVIWAVNKFSDKDESPQITQKRVDEIEILLQNYDKHPKDKTGQLNLVDMFIQAGKSAIGYRGDKQNENQEEPVEDDELNGFLD